MSSLAQVMIEATSKMQNDNKKQAIQPQKHKTVRIPRGIVEALEDFLKTDQAAHMGFDSKADVVTEAIRSLLTECGYYQHAEKREEKTGIQKKSIISERT